MPCMRFHVPLNENVLYQWPWVTNVSVLCRRLLQDESVKKKYRYLITNSFVEANRSLTWCPRPGCVNAVFAADREERAVRCSCDGMFW